MFIIYLIINHTIPKGECTVLGGFHYLSFTGCFVINSAEVEYTMNNYPEKFPIVWRSE